MSMMLSELNESNLSDEQADLIIKACDAVATEINDPAIDLHDVARMYVADMAELDRWEAAQWD